MNISEDKIARQIELNNLMKMLENNINTGFSESVKELGKDKFIRNNERVSKNEGFGESSVGKRLSGSAVNGFVTKFEDYIDIQLNQSSRSSIVKVNLHEELDPAMIGKVIIRSILNNIMAPKDKKCTVGGVVFDIGEKIEITIKQVKLDMFHAKDVRKLEDMLRRQDRLGDKEEVAMMMNKLAEDVDLEHKNWTKAQQNAVGQVLLELMYTSNVSGMEDTKFSDIFYETRELLFRGSIKTIEKYITITEKGLAWIKDNEDFLSSMSMSYLPMVIPPKNWTSPYDGGYHDPAIRKTYNLIKGSRTDVSELLEKFPQGFDVLRTAINNIQKTPFRVNNYVLGAIKYVHKNQIDLSTKGVPRYVKAYVEFIGEEKTKEFFDLRKTFERTEDGKMVPESIANLLAFARSAVEDSDQLEDKDVWKEWSKIRKSINKFAESDNSKKILLDNVIRDASRFLNIDIYFAYNADYRSRIYPLAGQFSPQGSDTSRGLLEFANGVKPTSTVAITMIAREIANNYGEDKISFEDRVKWVEDNTSDILECANDFTFNDFWTKADKPFLFLMGCKEWAKVIKARKSGDELNFISTMPCGFDGSCNGIQHYSALFKDPRGAAAVNLINHALPADVYREVSEQALKLCESKNTRVAKLVIKVNEDLKGKLFGRDVSKRSVMTLPYGVSQGSSNKYVYETVEKHMKGYTEVSSAQKKNIRSLIGKLIWEAITLVVEKPVTGKEYFQEIATELAKAGSGLTWITPTGMPVKQMLMKKEVKPHKVRVTVNGKALCRHYPRYSDEIDAREQANAIAPNFVHSFDSSHLQLTVNAAVVEGMTNFLFIHDSFATDCNRATRFNDIIREEFVKMYKEDHINGFHDRVEVVLDRKSGVPRQTMGDFNMQEVLSAKYFFS
jgi:DNA-directed RNA polymerase